MKSADINVFLSCSYASNDTKVNDLVSAVCEGLDIKPTNVSNGYVTLPPEEAKKQIQEAPFIIAIITKRLESVDGKNIMPSAVREEIAMAYGLSKPLLLITEKGIELDGFMKSYGTHLAFEKESIHDNEFIKKLIMSIHGAKMDIVTNHDLLISQGIEDFYVDYLEVLYELKENEDGYYWEYSLSKKIIFNKKYDKPMITAFWATRDVEIPEDAKKIEFNLELVDSNKDFSITTNILKHDFAVLETELSFSPIPEAEDFIEYSTIAKSKYLSPLFIEDLIDKTPIVINDKEYLIYDGTIPIQRTKKLALQIRFPKSYKIDSKDITFFAAGYSSKIDYIVPSEDKRAQINIENFAGRNSISIEIESPLVGHLYGIAWKPPVKEKK